MDESLLALLNSDQAVELRQQSLVDAFAALEVILHADTSWEIRHDAVHYAFGSTAIVGLMEISDLLDQAAIVILNRDAQGLAMLAEKLMFQLSDFEGTY